MPHKLLNIMLTSNNEIWVNYSKIQDTLMFAMNEAMQR